MELIVIALHGPDIYLVDMKTGAKVSGPHVTYQEAVNALKAAQKRIRQGWAP